MLESLTLAEVDAVDMIIHELPMLGKLDGTTHGTAHLTPTMGQEVSHLVPQALIKWSQGQG